MFNIEGNSNYKVYIDDGYVVKKSSNKISRSKFLSITASLAYGLPITSLTYGILSNNVYDYRVKRRKISFSK